MPNLTYRKRKYLSVSTLLSYTRCKRRYFYQKNGLEQNETPLAPQYGNAHHKAIPVALETADIDLAMAAFLEGWGSVEEQIAMSEDPPSKKWNRTRARCSLSHYIHTHKDNKSIFKLTPPPSGAIKVDNLTSNFEVPWAIDIGLSVPLVGRLDSLCQHRDTNENWVWEFKTTSRLNAQFFEAHDMSIQNLTYTLAARTMTSLDIQGVIVEGMLISPNKVENMTHPILVQPHHLEAIKKWLYRTGAELLDLECRMKGCTDPADVWTQNFAACTPYSFFYMPGYRCEFADLCRVPDWKSMTALYDIKPEHDFLALTVEGKEAVK